MGCRSFIVKVVKDTWVWHLRDPDSFYTRVAPRDILDLFVTHSGEIERADIVSMFTTMYLWWSEDPCVPEFVNRFKDAQEKSTRACLTITDDWLPAMATSALLSENSFPNDLPSWDGLVASAQTLTAWRLKFPPLHSTANLAMAAHEITGALPTHPISDPASKDYMSQFDVHFDNLAAAVTKINIALDQLAATTTTQ